MADKKASKDAQGKCKCGNAVGDLLTGTYRLEDLLERIKFEDAHKHIPEHKESVNYIYGDANNVAESCNIDARIEQNHAMKAFGKLENMEIATSSNIFYKNRNEILNNLSSIRNGITEKIRDCSKGQIVQYQTGDDNYGKSMSMRVQRKSKRTKRMERIDTI